MKVEQTMEFECQGWKLSVDKDATIEWYLNQEKDRELDWVKFQENYIDTVEFLEKLYIDLEKPYDYQVVSINEDGTKEYELVYSFFGTAADGEYEIDFGCVNICLENAVDETGQEVTQLYIYNIFL